MLFSSDSFVYPFPPTSITRLRSVEYPHCRLWVKRDDELPFGGSKSRKYSSLIPAIVRSGKRKVFLEGSLSSNHTLEMMRLLKSRGYEVFVPEGKGGRELLGNRKLLHMLSPRYVSSFPEDSEMFIVREGGSQVESKCGALTLGQEIPASFSHIFLEAGTGFMAGALLETVEVPVHILLLALRPEEFIEQLHTYFTPRAPYTLHVPETLRSFGSTNRKLFRFIQEFSSREGILLDPLYSSKLFYHAKKILDSLHPKPEGDLLWIHQGGLFSWTGFIDFLK